MSRSSAAPSTRARADAGPRERPGRRAAAPRTPGPAREAVLAVRSVDGRALAPTRLWIEAGAGTSRQQPPARVRCLEVDRSVLGPIRTRNGGLAENVVITDSIVQGFRTSAGPGFTADDVFDPVLLYDQLSPGRATTERPRAQANPLSAFIWRSVGGHPPDRPAGSCSDGQEPPAARRRRWRTR